MTANHWNLKAILGRLFSPRLSAGRPSPIVRIWHGITAERVADQYLEHIKKTGIPSYRRVRGNLAAYVLRRTSNGATEFVVVSIWNSWDAIRRFTGSEDPSAAIYYEEDERYLIFKEPKAAHYELALVHESDSSVVYEYNPFEGTA